MMKWVMSENAVKTYGNVNKPGKSSQMLINFMKLP